MDIDSNILIRYFQGECTEWEKEAIRVWLESDEAHKKQFIRERIRFDASVVIDENKLSSSGVSNKGKTFIWNTLKIASAILILIASSYCFSLYQSDKPDSSLQSIYVPSGSRTSVTLPDGILVWLNSNTSFKYPTTFASENRIVELDGEAYFEVTKKEKKSFIVKTDKYDVEVLGTTFNVEAYANEPTFKTGLFTGKVKLYKELQENESLYLNPGESAELIGDVLHISAANQNSFRWKDGLIILEDKSFTEIMRLFEKYYDLQIIIKNDKTKGLGYKGKLRISDGIDHALRVLQKDFHFTYKRKEDTNIIYIY
ncbi:MAG: FecR family protein [Parabacteroides sp.]|nr:FecR family protein [Parabacteroides sp.]